MSSQNVHIAAEPRRVFIPLRPAEVKAFRKRRKLPGPEWAEKNIVVPIGSRQGVYQHKNNPPLYGILDILSRPHVRKGVIGKGIQTGGTLAVYILVLREADYSSGGDNALLVMADEASVKKLSKGRLRKMIDKSPLLSALKSSNPDDTAIRSITLADGFTIDAAWISSETSVSSESYRVLVLDEISKPAYQKHRGHIADAKGRTTVYPDTKKIFVLSSPDVDSDDPAKRDPLLDEMESCDVQYDYYVTCPDCGVEQVMIFENFGWPQQPSLLPGQVPTANPAEIRRQRSAWYQCQHCPSRWNDYKRDKAVLLSMKKGWQPTIPGIEFPESVYIHYPSWLSPYVSLSEVVARWLEAQGDEALLQKWHNLIAGISYKRSKQDRKEDGILRLRDQRAAGMAPLQVDAIEISIDTQDHGFWYRIRAWQYGLALTSWLVKAGYVSSASPDDFSGLDALLAAEYPDENGQPHRIMAGIIDTKGHRTAEVYAWCRRTGIMAGAGAPGRKTQPMTVSRIDRFPGNGRPIPGGLALYHIDTHYHKDMLANKLLIDPTDPGALLLHSGYTYDQLRALERDPSQQLSHNLGDYAKQMCVEVRDDRGLWQCAKGKANHLWDCESNGLALALWMGWQNAISDRASAAAAVSQANQQSSPAGNSRPGWFNNR